MTKAARVLIKMFASACILGITWAVMTGVDHVAGRAAGDFCVAVALGACMSEIIRGWFR